MPRVWGLSQTLDQVEASEGGVTRDAMITDDAISVGEVQVGAE